MDRMPFSYTAGWGESQGGADNRKQMDCGGDSDPYYCRGGSNPPQPNFCRAGYQFMGAAQPGSTVDTICTPVSTSYVMPASNANEVGRATLNYNRARTLYTSTEAAYASRCGLGMVNVGDACAPCPAGYKCDASMALEQGGGMIPCQNEEYCAMGTGRSGRGSRSYLKFACPAGTFSMTTTVNGDAVNACANCPPGTNSSLGSTRCSTCPIGTTSTAGAQNCSYTVTGSGTTLAHNCPAGTFLDSAATGCKACANGFYTYHESTGQKACTAVAGGRFAVTSAFNVTVPTSSSSTTLLFPSTTYPAALFMPIIGSTYGMPCASGTYSSTAGASTACTPCPKGKYAASDQPTGSPTGDPGPTGCTWCPGVTTALNSALKTTAADGAGVSSASCF